MKLWFKISLLILVIITYIIAVNVISDYQPSNYGNSISKDNQGTNNEVGVGSSANIKVLKDRWYGTIEDNIQGDNKDSFLYTFKYIRLPISSGWFYVHILFLMIFVVSFYLVIVTHPFITEAKHEKVVIDNSEHTGDISE